MYHCILLGYKPHGQWVQRVQKRAVFTALCDDISSVLPDALCIHDSWLLTAKKLNGSTGGQREDQVARANPTTLSSCARHQAREEQHLSTRLERVLA